MSKFLKKTLYLGMSALMLGSVGAVGGQAVAPTRVSAHRARRLHVQTWYRHSVAFNRGIRGHAIYSEPKVMPGAHKVASRAQVARAMANGARFSAYKSMKINHRYLYYKVESNHGRLRGWVWAPSVYVIHHHVTQPAPQVQSQPQVSTRDQDALDHLYRDADRSELLADFSNINANNPSIARSDWRHAQNYLYNAKACASRITGASAKQKASQIVNSLEAHFAGVAQARTGRENRLSNAVNRDVNTASSYLNVASHNQSGAKAYLNMADTLLKNATQQNHKISDANIAHGNAIMISNARSFADLIAKQFNLKPNTHANVKTAPKAPANSGAHPSSDVINNGGATMKRINSAYSAANAQIKKLIADLRTDPTLLNQSSESRATNLVHSEINNIKNMMKLLTNKSDIAKAQNELRTLEKY